MICQSVWLCGRRHIYSSFRAQLLRLAQPYHVVSCFRFDQVMCDWLNHTMWFHSNPALPRSMEFESILFHFWTQYSRQYAICRLFDNRKYMDIYISLYIRNTAILENKKSVCIFPHQLVNSCDLHLFRLLKCAICRTILVKMPSIGQFSPILKVY